MKMQVSFKHGSCFGEFGCKTPQQLFSLSYTVGAISCQLYRRGRIIASLRNVDTFLYRDVSTFCRRLKTRFLENVSIERHLLQKCCLFRIDYIDGINRILNENIVCLRNVESFLYRGATRFLVQTE